MSVPVRLFVSVLLLVYGCLPALVAAAKPAEEANSFEAALQRGEEALQHGQLESAAIAWERALVLDDVDALDRVDLHGQLAATYLRSGKYAQAVEHLEAALQQAAAAGDPYRQVQLRRQLGATYLRGGHIKEARAALNLALQQAGQLDYTAAIAATCNDLGTLEMHLGHHDRSDALFLRGAETAGGSGDWLLAAKAWSNKAASFLDSGAGVSAADDLERAEKAVRKLQDSHDKAFVLLRLGILRSRLGERTRDAADRNHAYQLFREAHRLGESLGDPRTDAYALGYLGKLYQEQGRTDDALRLTQRAIFLARSAAADESLYRWQWQAARLLQAQGQAVPALDHYRQAAASLERIRAELVMQSHADRRSFSGEVADLYQDYVSVLLDLGIASTETETKAGYLWEAQEVMERLKAAELQDYFQDDCVAAAQEKVKRIDRALSGGTVVMYPIVLPERVVLLLTFADGMDAVQVDVPAARINDELNSFRRKLEKRSTRQFLKPARQLYNWLIRPVEASLQARDIHTLVIVPGGTLRTVPLSALHDGERYLIEKYAIATTPGIELTDPRPIDRDNISILLSGVSEPRGGFGGLPYVGTELDEIQARLGGYRLQDESFVSQALRSELEAENYAIVHIASHGKFEAQIDDSFILTYDDRLKLNALERYMSVNRYRDKPVELLTLSACQTAAGDDRAALGLAGVAVKAGARSALASLWHINDQATAMLVDAFYAGLQDPALSKAQALRRAQLGMLKDLRYRHPGYWSAFLLIGNWL